MGGDVGGDKPAAASRGFVGRTAADATASSCFGYGPLRMRAVSSFVLLFAAAANAQQPPPDTAALAAMPLATLRTIGAAANAATARSLAAALRTLVPTPTLQTLVRTGLVHTDERVVFGAAIVLGGELPVPELRRAMTTILPRFGDDDCPVDADVLLSMLGSCDIPALLPRLAKLPPGEATKLLSQCHRLCRLEHVPALCALALRADPRVADEAISNARLAVLYAGEGHERVVMAKLQRAGIAPEPGDPGMSPVLRAALSALASNPALGSGVRPPVDTHLCAHWLATCRIGRADQPLLLRVLSYAELGRVAVRCLPDPMAAGVREQVLAADAAYDLPLDYASARAGDGDALERLFAAEDYGHLSLALDAASPQRRRQFAEALLASAPQEALATLRELADAARGSVSVDPAVVPYDDAWLAELEPLAARAGALDLGVLRALVAAVPTCATTRLADRLLAAPAAELFAPAHGAEDQVDDELRGESFLGEIGFSGPWAFLEVTRPEPFRQRLREGLSGGHPFVRELCGRLLLRLHDAASAPALVAWSHDRLAAEAWDDAWWIDLAVCGGEASDEVRRRVVEAAPGEASAGLLAALAVVGGMPLAVRSQVRFDDTADVRARLLADKPVEARLAMGEVETSEAALWPEPALLQACAPEWRELAFQDQLEFGCLRGDRDSRQLLRQLCLDGRYATHHGFERAKAIDRDLSQLPFWIDECGTNCCRYIDGAAPALRNLFGRHPEYDTGQWSQPVAVRLRRHLLPRRDRLRWSHIANGYVVAGD